LGRLLEWILKKSRLDLDGSKERVEKKLKRGWEKEKTKRKRKRKFEMDQCTSNSLTRSRLIETD